MSTYNWGELTHLLSGMSLQYLGLMNGGCIELLHGDDKNQQTFDWGTTLYGVKDSYIMGVAEMEVPQ